MNLQYLIKYKSFITVEDMDTAVQSHIQTHYEKLTESDKAVLYCLAKHSLTAIGACHLKTDTIANEIGVSVKTVYRATKKLSELGIITKYKTIKSTGQGASIYVIAPIKKDNDVCHLMSPSCPSLETHVNAVVSTDSHVKNNAVTKNLITSSFNPFVKFVDTYKPRGQPNDLKKQLRAIYQPRFVEDNEAFEELCKIAFGRLKQYMNSHNMPYLQMSEIVLKAMSDLKRKQNVNNQFALYSAMIKRQVEQLFEQPIKPVQTFNKLSDDNIPDWFYKRNDSSTVVNKDTNIDFEAERAAILEKLNS